VVQRGAAAMTEFKKGVRVVENFNDSDPLLV
jgi:hypothetical protein